MKAITLTTALTMCALGVSTANGAISDADAAKLLTKYNCQACHTTDSKLVGPAFRDVAKKYADSANAAAMLEGSIQHGSTGTWGQLLTAPAL